MGDIVPTKKERNHMDAFQTDKDDYYEANLKIDTLILRNMIEEAAATV